ncbi:hypothetical protein JQ607_37580 [Bradyrhizobium liaoningense]|nr:hypothetical protein [Bradyrhizobium liaoningense]MBR0845937.1 hypothetical protein [Bradyrhizobium liaoningense]
MRHVLISRAFAPEPVDPAADHSIALLTKKVPVSLLAASLSSCFRFSV